MSLGVACALLALSAISCSGGKAKVGDGGAGGQAGDARSGAGGHLSPDGGADAGSGAGGATGAGGSKGAGGATGSGGATGGAGGSDGGTDGAPLGDAGMDGATATSGQWVMGYYVGYDINAYPIASIDWSGITHIAFAPLLVNANQSLDLSFNDENGTGQQDAMALAPGCACPRRQGAAHAGRRRRGPKHRHRGRCRQACCLRQRSHQCDDHAWL
jgi:hypothetical protein